MSLFCIAFVFKETLVKKPESFSWARANPLGSVCLLFSHGILVRFALMIAFVDVSAVQPSRCVFFRSQEAVCTERERLELDPGHAVLHEARGFLGDPERCGDDDAAMPGWTEEGVVVLGSSPSSVACPPP